MTRVRWSIPALIFQTKPSSCGSFVPPPAAQATMHPRYAQRTRASARSSVAFTGKSALLCPSTIENLINTFLFDGPCTNAESDSSGLVLCNCRQYVDRQAVRVRVIAGYEFNTRFHQGGQENDVAGK